MTKKNTGKGAVNHKLTALKQAAQQAISQGDFQQAATQLQAALKLSPKSASLQANLGAVYLSAGDYQAALRACRQAIKLGAGQFQVYFNLGKALLEVGALEEAVGALQQANQLQPQHPDILLNLGSALCQREDFEQAREIFSVLHKLEPNDRDTMVALAGVCFSMWAFPDAIELYQQLLAMDSHDQDSWTGLSMAHYHNLNYEEAKRCFRQALMQFPGSPELHMGHANLQLVLGNWERGWQEYEWRWLTEEFGGKRIYTAKPEWEGESIAGKRLLVILEQGFGDCVQFIRYAKQMAEQGVEIIVKSRTALVRLLEQQSYIELVTLDMPAEFDTYITLGSLPYACQARPDNIPYADQYLELDAALCVQWAEQLPAGFNVAFTWDAVSKRNAIPLDTMAEIFEVAGVNFVSVQYGNHADVLAGFAAASPVVHLGDKITDVADTAAIIAACDLVITIDTVTAHLAGALGKPVWMMLPYSADWRWLLDPETVPWYDSMRLFRQQDWRDWSWPITEVKKRLASLLA